MHQKIEDFLGSMYRIHNNDDLIDMRKMCNLDSTTPYCEKFGFCRCDSNHIMYSFDDRFVVAINVGYESSDLIFDAGIRYNNC